MNKHFPIIIFQLLACGLSAQSLGEDPGLSYYWNNQLGSARLYNDNGLGKEIWLRNLPLDWYSALSLEGFSNQHDAGFGHLLIAPKGIPKFGVNTNFSHFGEADATLMGQFTIKKVSSSLQLNGHYFDRAIDRNSDGFMDLPMKKRIQFNNVWEAHVPNYSSYNRIKYMAMEENGGQVSRDSNAYKTGLNLEQLDLHSQHLVAVRKKDLFLIDLRMKDHGQSRNWGGRNYEGKEWLAEGSARYEYHLENDLDIFRMGMLYRQQRYDERIDSQNLKREERMGGVFVGYDSYWGKHLLILTHVHLLYHNLAKLRISPMVKVNYSPLKQLAVNLYGGNSWRYANPLTENARYLYSGRNVTIPNVLQPENAWYYGLAAASGTWVNLDNYPFCNFHLKGSTKFTHNVFTQQVVADVDADAYELRFYNLEKGDKAYRLSWGLEGQISFSKPNLTINVDYRYDKAKTTIDGVLRELPFYSRHNWLIHLNYACYIKKNYRNLYLFNLQSFNYIQGSQRIPDLSAKSIGMPLSSGSFGRWDLQILFPIYSWIKSASKWKNFMLHLGFDNLTNVIQPVTVLHSEHPFGNGFDAGMGWNSWVGRRFYGGFKYVFN